MKLGLVLCKPRKYFLKDDRSPVGAGDLNEEKSYLSLSHL